MNAATSEPRNVSPSPIPTTSGESLRAPTTTSGDDSVTARTVKAPSRRRQVRRTASARSPPQTGSRSSTRWATVSVSVSEVSSWPAARSSSRRAAWFSHDAVVDDGGAPVARQVRVGVAVRRRAVRGPARVPDAGAPRQDVLAGLGQDLLQLGQLASLLLRGQAPVDHGDARGVVAAVLQAPAAPPGRRPAPAGGRRSRRCRTCTGTVGETAPGCPPGAPGAGPRAAQPPSTAVSGLGTPGTHGSTNSSVTTARTPDSRR